MCVFVFQTIGTRVSIDDILFYLKNEDKFFTYTESKLENSYETETTTAHLYISLFLFF